MNKVYNKKVVVNAGKSVKSIPSIFSEVIYDLMLRSGASNNWYEINILST